MQGRTGPFRGRMGSFVWSGLNGLMGALFVFAAALQYNDSHWLRWMLLYLAAAVPCVVAVRRRARWLLPAAIAAVGLIWVSFYVARGAWTVPLGEMFAEWEMKNQQVVDTREMFGLFIVVGWMAVLTVASLRPSSRNTEK